MISAISASLLWGISYAKSGPILKEALSPMLFYFYYSWIGALTATIVLLIQSPKREIFSPLLELSSSQLALFLFSLITASVGALMTYRAVGAKNATLASMIEISYPFFVFLFTWMFFGEVQLTLVSGLGAVFILIGVILILLTP